MLRLPRAYLDPRTYAYAVLSLKTRASHHTERSHKPPPIVLQLPFFCNKGCVADSFFATEILLRKYIKILLQKKSFVKFLQQDLCCEKFCNKTFVTKNFCNFFCNKTSVAEKNATWPLLQKKKPCSRDWNKQVASQGGLQQNICCKYG